MGDENVSQPTQVEKQKGSVATGIKKVFQVIFNIFWFVFGGLPLTIMCYINMVVSCLLIIPIFLGVPKVWFTLSKLCFAPYGKKININYGSHPVKNTLYLIFGGLFEALGFFNYAILFFITLIGIPHGKQMLKFAKFAIAPFGAEVISEYATTNSSQSVITDKNTNNAASITNGETTNSMTVSTDGNKNLGNAINNRELTQEEIEIYAKKSYQHSPVIVKTKLTYFLRHFFVYLYWVTFLIAGAFFMIYGPRYELLEENFFVSLPVNRILVAVILFVVAGLLLLPVVLRRVKFDKFDPRKTGGLTTFLVFSIIIYSSIIIFSVEMMYIMFFSRLDTSYPYLVYPYEMPLFRSWIIMLLLHLIAIIGGFVTKHMYKSLRVDYYGVKKPTSKDLKTIDFDKLYQEEIVKTIEKNKKALEDKAKAEELRKQREESLEANRSLLTGLDNSMAKSYGSNAFRIDKDILIAKEKRMYFILTIVMGVIYFAIMLFGILTAAGALDKMYMKSFVGSDEEMIDSLARALAIGIGFGTISLVPTIGYFMAINKIYNLDKKYRILILLGSVALSIGFFILFCSMFNVEREEFLIFSASSLLDEENGSAWKVFMTIIVAHLGLILTYTLILFDFDESKLTKMRKDAKEILQNKETMTGKEWVKQISLYIVRGTLYVVAGINRIRKLSLSLYLILFTLIFFVFSMFMPVFMLVMLIIMIACLVIAYIFNTIVFNYKPITEDEYYVYDNGNIRKLTIVNSDSEKNYYKDEYLYSWHSDLNNIEFVKD